VFNKDEMDGTRPKAYVCISDVCENFGRLDQVYVTAIDRNEETSTSSVGSAFMSFKSSHTKAHSARFFLTLIIDQLLSTFRLLCNQKVHYHFMF